MTCRSTSTRPAVISSSQVRRLPRPAAASTFWSRSRPSSIALSRRLAALRASSSSGSCGRCGGRRDVIREGSARGGRAGRAGREGRAGLAERGGRGGRSAGTVGMSVEGGGGLRRRATIAAKGPDHTPADASRRMARCPGQNVRGKTHCLGMPPASHTRLLHRRPPAGAADFRNRRREVAWPGAVHERHPQARGRDVVLKVGIKPHGPAPLESLGAWVEPVGLAQRGAARRCRQGQSQGWQQQRAARVHGGTHRGLGAVGGRSVGTAPSAPQGRFRAGFGSRAQRGPRPLVQVEAAYGS